MENRARLFQREAAPKMALEVFGQSELRFITVYGHRHVIMLTFAII